MAEARNDERRSDLAVLDANEYKQKRRLERILDAHDNVEDAAAEARALLFEGEITEDALNIIVQEAVKRAIREHYNLLIDHAEDVDGRDAYWQGDPENPIGELERAHSEPVRIVGLRDFTRTDWFYVDSWTSTENPRNRPRRQVEHQEEYTMPRRISWDAYERLKRFLRVEQDLEIQFEWLDDQRPMVDWGEDDERLKELMETFRNGTD